MPPKSVQKTRSQVVDQLLIDKASLLSKFNFKKVLEEASKSKISCEQLTNILKKVHEEFIYHINNNLQPQLNNLDQLNLNEPASTSDVSNSDQSTIIHQLQFEIEALENEKALFDNLSEINKKALTELEMVEKEFDGYKFNVNKQLSLRDDFTSYLIRTVKMLYQLLNISTPPYEQAESNPLAEKDLIKLKEIDRLLLNLILELKRKNANQQRKQSNLNK